MRYFVSSEAIRGEFLRLKIFPKLARVEGNLSLRSDEPVSAYERRQIIEWSDFVGAVAAADANFDPATAGSPFLTESLILAQNERWRRG